MPGDYARSVQILIELAGNPEQRLNEINKLVDQLNSKKITLTDSMAQVGGASNNAVDSLKKVSNSTQDVTKNANDLGTKGVSAFDKIRGSVGQLNDGVQTLAASLAGIAAGGAISGLSWKASADFKLINEQIDDALAANKKLGISKEEMDAFVKEQAESGEGTRQDTKSEIYSVLMASQKYLKGDSLSKLNQADAITDFWFSRQEIMKQQGISSPEQLIQMTTRSEGKMIGTQLARFQTATGASEKDVGSAESRMKFLTGQKTDMKAEMDKRPWEAMLVAVTQLKYAIGDGIAPAMTLFINLLAKGVKLINMIPHAPTLIGLAGGVLAAVSAFSLLNSVVRPGISLLTALTAAETRHQAVQAIGVLWNKAQVASMTLLTGVQRILGISLVATAGATGVATAANVGLAASEWAVLSPLLLIAAPLVLIAGLLYLAETKTKLFSNAFKALGKTQMSKDLIQWFKDVGYWVNAGIGALDALYKKVKEGAGGEGMKMNLLLALGPLGFVLKSALPLIPVFLEMISDGVNYLKNLLDNGWKTISGIYNGIVTLPQKLSTFITTGISTLLSKIPGFGGEGKSEEGFIEFIRSAKKGDANYDKYAQLSDEALRAAYREAQTGIPQPHPNMIDPYEYDNIVKNGYSEYMKSSPPIINNVNNVNNVSLVGAADKVLQEDIANVNKKLENGEPISGLSTDMGNPSGLIKTAYNYFFGDGFADGGYVKKTGLALVHSGEPIIPADVANSSRLQNILENIASGGSTTSSINNDPVINIYYNVDPRSGITMSDADFERRIKKVVSDALRQKNGY